MQLKKFTDYSLRLLIQLAVNPDIRININTVASAFNISRNHLLKIVTELNRQGLIDTQRGKHGGLRLNRPAADINIGQLIASLEGRAPMVDCMDPKCPIAPACGLKGVLDEAQAAFYRVLERTSLEDLVRGREAHIQELISV